MESAWKLVDLYCKEAALVWNRGEEVAKNFRYFKPPQPMGGVKTWAKVVRDRALPLQVIEMHNAASTALFGYFPEIKRAWALLDHSLCMWRVDGENRVWIWSSLLDGIVFAVGLVKPVPNFVAAEYLLVLATPLKLFLYGVNCSQDGGLIYSMRDYDTSSLGTTMRCMVSTSSGRMFLAGCDGHIYELLYSTGPPCGLQFTIFKLGAVDPVVEMVVDNDRNILYARTEKMKLEAYSLGINVEGGPIDKLGEGYDLSNEPSIVTMSPLSELESKWLHAHLVVVLSDGSRRYFSTSSSGISFQTMKCRPVFGKDDHNSEVEPAYCSLGTLILARPSTGKYVIVRKDSRLHTRVGGTSSLRELALELAFTYRSLKLAPVRMIFVADVLPTPDTASPMLSLYSQVLGKSDEKTCGILRGRGDLLTQHILPNTKILLASTRTVVELVFNRPVDILNTLLKSSSTCSRVSLNAFVDHFGADETAAMCLMLASGIIMFGGDEFDSLVPTRAAMVFGDMKMERMPQLGGSQAAIHSAAHAGLYLCTARLLYPLWNTHVMSTRSSSDSMSEGGELICRFSADAMHELESRIRSLEKCLLRRSDAEDSAGQRLPNKHDNISKEDTHSMECCRHLIQRSAEALFLLQILSRHDIAISSQMFEESLLHLEFRHLVISGDDDKIAKVLISALMESGSTKSFEELLLEGCPSYSKNILLSLRDSHFCDTSSVVYHIHTLEIV